jgi:hypothetical protein
MQHLNILFRPLKFQETHVCSSKSIGIQHGRYPKSVLPNTLSANEMTMMFMQCSVFGRQQPVTSSHSYIRLLEQHRLAEVYTCLFSVCYYLLILYLRLHFTLQNKIQEKYFAMAALT